MYGCGGKKKKLRGIARSGSGKLEVVQDPDGVRSVYPKFQWFFFAVNILEHVGMKTDIPFSQKSPYAPIGKFLPWSALLADRGDNDDDFKIVFRLDHILHVMLAHSERRPLPAPVGMGMEVAERLKRRIGRQKRSDILEAQVGLLNFRVGTPADALESRGIRHVEIIPIAPGLPTEGNAHALPFAGFKRG